VLAPAVVLLALVLVTTIPIQLLVIMLLALIPRFGRITRIVALLSYYLVLEGLALVVLFGLWIASGFGYALQRPFFQKAHYRLAGWILGELFRFARWSLRLTIHYTGADIDHVAPGAPLIIASRHAGPGDSFILVNTLINGVRREPRIVLKDTLQWDPTIDVLMNRLPMVFLTPTPFSDRDTRVHGSEPTKRIAHMAMDMDKDDALVVFPEGGNFSPNRRDSRIRQLKDGGYADLADRAASMRNLLAPRPGGLFAAVDAKPDAGLVFVGHTGLEQFDSLKQLWQALPMNKTLVMNSWYVAPQDIPAGKAERVEWLFDWWERIDAWIEATDINTNPTNN
jgi:1-acyl-sn-glycerol-3-phosphate acyltransferase